MRAYYGLRANERELALRAWLYRIAHNRCVDELRRPHPIAVEVIDGMVTTLQDPVTKVEQRDALRRLIADVQRLPEQQRSALLMRELSGMAYHDVAGAMGVSVSAVKSLLVRARVSLAQASEARDTACTEIREDLIDAHDRGVRTSGLARRHMRDCHDCREFRTQVRGVTRGLAALTPTLGPLGVIANLLGWGSGAGGSAVASGAGRRRGGGGRSGRRRSGGLGRPPRGRHPRRDAAGGGGGHRRRRGRASEQPGIAARAPRSSPHGGGGARASQTVGAPECRQERVHVDDDEARGQAAPSRRTLRAAPPTGTRPVRLPRRSARAHRRRRPTRAPRIRLRCTRSRSRRRSIPTTWSTRPTPPRPGCRAATARPPAARRPHPEP